MPDNSSPPTGDTTREQDDAALGSAFAILRRDANTGDARSIIAAIQLLTVEVRAMRRETAGLFD